MSLLSIENLSHTYGDKKVLDGISFRLLKGERAGLVGANGSGKTTFLNILSENILHDEGTVLWAPGIKKGYLKQYEAFTPGATLMDVLREAFSALYQIEAEIAALADKLSACSEDEMIRLLNRMGHLQEMLDQSDFYRIDGLIEDAAAGLGLKGIGLDTPAQTLSGGQKTKLMLARLLLEKPDVLLLDEPTNYLDQEHIRWLTGYLSSYPGSIILVSHDISFLNSVVNVIWHLEFTKMTRYPGNYDKFLKLSAERQQAYIQNYERQQKEIARMEDFIRKNIVRASTTGRAQSRQKALERMEKLEKPVLLKKPLFQFKMTREPEKVVLETLELEVGYDRTLLPKLDMRLERGQKVAITGFNGIGKTTLLKSLLGIIPLRGGIVSLGRFVTPAYFEQEEVLPKDATALSYIWNLFPGMAYRDIRKTLSQCGLVQDHLEKPMASLSGGERSKARLCRLMLTPANLLILDEPTNHLDKSAKEALRDALVQYKGSVLLVCHEKDFCEGWIDEVWDLERIGCSQKELVR